MPRSIRRIMGRSPSSISAMPTGCRQSWANRSRVTNRVRPPGSGTSRQAQVLVGVRRSIRSGWWKESTTKAVVSVGRGAIGSQRPTERSCSSGTIRRALGRARSSSSSSAYQPARRQPACTNQGHTSSGGAATLIARVQRYRA
jgi:hypothetical protein